MDRIERHDLFNAVGLAVVLMVLAFGFLWAAQSLYSTVRDDTVETQSNDPVVATTPTVEDGASTTTADPNAGSTTSEAATDLHPVGEVTVRVANGASISGVASHQTTVLSQAGYLTGNPGNVADITGPGQVFYIDGYEADAVEVARVLGMGPEVVLAMTDPPPFDLDGAQILVIAGPDTTVRP